MDPREIVRRFQNDMHEENHNIAELSQAFHTNPDQIDDAPDTLAPIIDCHFDQSGNVEPVLVPTWQTGRGRNPMSHRRTHYS
ncbi:hypothetical protein Ae201684P_017188 [Aphanomyces euteiches]|nr:hypothetical protein Ae201684P_017188 [Aphanomyces euteiches]